MTMNGEPQARQEIPVQGSAHNQGEAKGGGVSLLTRLTFNMPIACEPCPGKTKAIGLGGFSTAASVGGKAGANVVTSMTEAFPAFSWRFCSFLFTRSSLSCFLLTSSVSVANKIRAKRPTI